MKTDIVIIGSGIAGLTAALKAVRFSKVTLIAKEKLQESNTYYAQGGLAAAIGHDDNIETHIQDTLRAGDGISERMQAKILATESAKRIQELKELGVRFDTRGKKYRLSREAVHSRARIIHASDMTGKEIQLQLVKKARENQNITILEYHMGLDLIVHKKKCVGVQVLDLKTENTFSVFAKKTVLATGGLGRLYSKTTNPHIATGDGIAMAFRAGAQLQDMEFVQFHPTMLHNSEPSFLISETLRGEGGILKNKHGKAYMGKYHRDGELAPRDVVAKFSVIEMQKTNAKHTFLDMTHIEEAYLKKRFPHIYKECLKYGIDMAKQMIPVSPAAHYVCGGIKTDSFGQASVKNLYAIGECACTGLHGADRLASNSMTEGLVYGTRLAEKIRKEVKKEKVLGKETEDRLITSVRNGRVEKIKKLLQGIMWQQVGIIRSKKGLVAALGKIKKLEAKLKKLVKESTNKEVQELKNMLLLGKIIIINALRRKESRGTHFILDYPERHDNIWKTHLVIDKKYRGL